VGPDPLPGQCEERLTGRCDLIGNRPRVAIVLFNLGGPDSPDAIRPFLLNLFSDPAILRVPFFVRPFLARTIAKARLNRRCWR
jgi:hypothetical protein